MQVSEVTQKEIGSEMLFECTLSDIGRHNMTASLRCDMKTPNVLIYEETVTTDNSHRVISYADRTKPIEKLVKYIDDNGPMFTGTGIFVFAKFIHVAFYVQNFEDVKQGDEIIGKTRFTWLLEVEKEAKKKSNICEFILGFGYRLFQVFFEDDKILFYFADCGVHADGMLATEFINRTFTSLEFEPVEPRVESGLFITDKLDGLDDVIRYAMEVEGFVPLKKINSM
jgi:hypothetical protein